MSLSKMTFQRRRVALALLAFVLTLSCGLAAALSFRAARDWISGPTDASLRSLAGTWHGKWHGVEAVNLQIDSRNEHVTGTIRFYRVAQTEQGLRADGQTDDLPLIDPQFTCQTLFFHVSNNARHGELVEADIEMRLISEGKAELRRVDGDPPNPSKDQQTVVEMTREE